MSDKPDSLGRRGFFRSFLPRERYCEEAVSETEGQPETPSTGTSRRGFMRVVRNGLIAIGLGSLLSEEEALATPTTNRFKLQSLIDPYNASNYASGQKRYEILGPLTDRKTFDMHPHLWPSDDVRKKDRKKFGKMSLDIPSPSIAFEAVKQLQRSVKSRHAQIVFRISALDYIKRDSDNFKHIANTEHPLHKRHKQLKEVYDREYEMNKQLVQMWDAIHEKMEPLRQAVKKAVILEMQACKSLRRCTVKRTDVDPVDLSLQIPTLPSKQNPDFQSYAGVNIPSQFKVEGYTCANINPNSSTQGGLTNSQILENAKFLVGAVTAHVVAAEQREEDYMQMEKLANEIAGVYAVKARKKLSPTITTKVSGGAIKSRLAAIYRKERRFNSKALTSWDNILNTVTAIKQQIAAAEAREASSAEAIDRCLTQ